MGVNDTTVYIGGSANALGDPVYAHIRMFSRAGVPGGEWKVEPGYSPIGICCYGNDVYVASEYGLHKYDSGGGLVWEHAYYGSGVGQFITGYAMACDGDFVYLSDYSQNKTLKYACSDGSFDIESSDTVPASPVGNSLRDEYFFVTKGWGVNVFYKDDLSFICGVNFENNEHTANDGLDTLFWDGSFFWGIGDDEVVKFTIHVIGE